MSFTNLASFVAVAGLLVAPAFAHMELATPAPLRSKSNPRYAGSPLIDYSYTTPLSLDGSQFPCKGYHVDVGSVASAAETITAGQPYTVTIGGGAAHNGGSCQFSLSYDKGASWGAIHSVVGGCPLQSSYTFTVPAEVPAGKDVLFAWTWFNKSGNREMYMNCAAVNIDSSGGGITVPQMFVANIFGSGTCNTVEGQDVDFANPSGAMSNCPADKLVTPDKTINFGAGGAPPKQDPPKQDSPKQDSPATDDDPCPGEDQTPPPPPPSSSSPPKPTSTPTPPPPPPSTGGGACSGGAIQCSADGMSWSMCANGAWVSMGAVASGTKCQNGAITRRSSRLYGRAANSV